MIISRTPYRISFFGGGTDYPSWYQQHGGAVLASTINKYCYLTCRYLPPFFDHKFRIVYSKMENCASIDEIKHPAIREVLRYLDVNRGVEIHHDGDLPARSGMGSSSAFTVGLVHALSALKGKILDRHELARLSIHLEQEVLKEVVGSQDQVLAAHGGLVHVSFHCGGEFTVRPITISRSRVEELNSHLMLIYTGMVRTASDIAQTYGVDTESRSPQLETMQRYVDEAVSILGSSSCIKLFGGLLHEAWQVKRSLSPKVSSSEIDALYNEARAAGAIGGKITGAGGGGFMLLFVEPKFQDNVRQRLRKLLRVPFKFESSGSNIIFYDTEEDFESLG
jgi:D-glycero-alpha-D-manno-heptose-7-phosphate kinase